LPRSSCRRPLGRELAERGYDGKERILLLPTHPRWHSQRRLYGERKREASWEDGIASALPDFKNGSQAWGNNNQGQIVGTVGSANGQTQTGALWQNGTLTVLDLLPGDVGGIAFGINSEGQVVGGNWDSDFNWSHAFIWQNRVMTDLNTLFPSDSNLFATFAAKINDRGQIRGMAIVRSGPDKGDVHAFLATPVNESIGRSVADDSPTRPRSNLPASASKRLLQFLRSGVACH
jgi:probable HAF family extracellular repeat protein